MSDRDEQRKALEHAAMVDARIKAEREAALKALSEREYFRLHSEQSTLDGAFTAEELRAIADKMDEMKAAE